MEEKDNEAGSRVLARINDAMSNRRNDNGRVSTDEPTYSFQHLSIERFKVGKFQFHDGVCKVPESQIDEFLRLWDGLQASDKNQIVNLKEEVNTRTLREFKAVRGALGTADIKAPVKDAAVPNNDSASQQNVSDAAQVSTGSSGGLKLPNLTNK